MSQNLIGIAKKYKGEWFVFPETAEEIVGDKEKYIGPNDDVLLNEEKYWVKKPKEEWKRKLEITSNCTLGPYKTFKEAVKKSQEDFFDGYFEYGVSTTDYIDDVKLVLTYNGEEVEEDKEEDLDDQLESAMEIATLKKRVENLEDFLDTQTRINAKLLRMLADLATTVRERKMKGEKRNKFEEKYHSYFEERKERTYKEYAQLCNKALEKGDLIRAFRIAAETDLIPDPKKNLEEKFYIWWKDQNWDPDMGEYIIANWFGIRPLLPRDIDGKELKKEDTLYEILPLMTEKQAWRFIKVNRKDLEDYFNNR